MTTDEVSTLNLSVKLTEVAPCQKQLRVEVPLEAVEQELEAVYRELKKVAHVPGFRIGNAPRDLLEQYHGKKAREQTLQRLIERSLPEALSAQGSLDLVGRPQVTEIKFEPKQPLAYTAQLEIAPEVPLGRYKGLKLTRSKVDVKEEAVAQVLERLREQQSELSPVLEPRAAAEGDFLLVDLTEQPKDKPPVKRRDLVISLNLEKDPEGVLRGLVGMTPGSQRSLTLKEGTTVTVDLKQLKVKQLPVLDDSFAKGLGPFASLEALRQALRQDLQKEAETSQRRVLDGQVSHELLEQWNFDVPPSLVGSQARRILKERAVDLMSQGVPSSEVQQRAQVLAEQAKLDALKQVKQFFILRRIASVEGISATEQEMEARIQALAQGMNTPVEQVRKDLESKDLLEELVWSIIRSKVIDLIIKEAEIRETTS